MMDSHPVWHLSFSGKCSGDEGYTVQARVRSAAPFVCGAVCFGGGPGGMHAWCSTRALSPFSITQQGLSGAHTARLFPQFSCPARRTYANSQIFYHCLV